MNKKLIALLLLSAFAVSSLFASGFSISSVTNYNVPVTGWQNSGSGYTSYKVNELYAPGFSEEVEVGYTFDNALTLGLAFGFGLNGFNATSATGEVYYVPVNITARYDFATVERLSFFVKGAVGAGFKFAVSSSKTTLDIQPEVSLALGTEVRVAAGFYIGLSARVNALFGVIGNTKSIQLDVVPFALNLRYQF